MSRYKNPPRHADTVIAYIEEGRPMGGFLTSLFANDLVAAFHRADEKNARLMKYWAAYLFDNVPSGCWGNYDKVKNWEGLFPKDVDDVVGEAQREYNEAKQR